MWVDGSQLLGEDKRFADVRRYVSGLTSDDNPIIDESMVCGYRYPRRSPLVLPVYTGIYRYWYVYRYCGPGRVDPVRGNISTKSDFGGNCPCNAAAQRAMLIREL